eukprot:scaffold21373_cov57-Attheya_sp.AAC.3
MGHTGTGTLTCSREDSNPVSNDCRSVVVVVARLLVVVDRRQAIGDRQRGHWSECLLWYSIDLSTFTSIDSF